MKNLVSSDRIERRIYLLRGHRVMLDSDLARIYGVTTARLNQQVHRNRRRFPGDFLFRLTRGEFGGLILQNATSSLGHGGRRKLPYAFTEHGAIMAASVLNTVVAVQASVQVVRAFVRLREFLATHKDLAKRLAVVERRLAGHDAELGKQAKEIKAVLEAIYRLMEPPEKPRSFIGFQPHPK